MLLLMDGGRGKTEAQVMPEPGKRPSEIRRRVLRTSLTRTCRIIEILARTEQRISKASQESGRVRSSEIEVCSQRRLCRRPSDTTLGKNTNEVLVNRPFSYRVPQVILHLQESQCFAPVMPAAFETYYVIFSWLPPAPVYGM